MNPQQCDPQKREASLVKIPLSILLKERKNDTTRGFWNCRGLKKKGVATFL
jgi:hypothetical protein